jgi:hypothetical protein
MYFAPTLDPTLRKTGIGAVRFDLGAGAQVVTSSDVTLRKRGALR